MARKASLSLMLGWFVVTIAGLAVADFGFGIAQAGGNHMNGPVLSFADQEAFEQSDFSSPSARVLPSGIDLSYDADGNPSTDMANTADLADVTQTRKAVEAGSLPAGSNEGDLYLFEGKLYGVP